MVASLSASRLGSHSGKDTTCQAPPCPTRVDVNLRTMIEWERSAVEGSEFLQQSLRANSVYLYNN